jgi:hypothetical protein
MNAVMESQIEPMVGHWYIDKFLGLPHVVDFYNHYPDPDQQDLSRVRITVYFKDEEKRTHEMNIDNWRAFVDHEIDKPGDLK